MNTEERVFVVMARIRGEKCNDLRDKFRRKFRKPGPTDNAIRSLVNKFKRTGSVTDENGRGRKRIDPTETERIQHLFEDEPRTSIRKASMQLNIPPSTVHKVLRCTLMKKPYRIQVLHALHEEDYPNRAARCAEFVDQIENDNLLNDILFSDEATFHTCGKVNRHNCRIWANERPTDFMEWERDSPKVNVWLGMTRSKIYGPFFFHEQSVTGNIYLDMLQLFLEPQLVSDGILDSVVFQHDGAPCHYAVIVRDYLNSRLPNRWIGRGGDRPWPPRSPDLTPLDFFAWGFVKTKVYQQKINNLTELKDRIRSAVSDITLEMLHNVFRNTKERFEICRDTDGQHVESFK